MSFGPIGAMPICSPFLGRVAQTYPGRTISIVGLPDRYVLTGQPDEYRLTAFPHNFRLRGLP